MPKEREVHIRGTQREQIDADLMAQIIIMLGHQFSRETMTEIPAEPDRHPEDDDEEPRS